MEKKSLKYKRVTYSYKEGLNFYIGDENLAFRIHIDALSNKRLISVNKEVIAEESGLKTLKRKSNYSFNEGGHAYEAELYTESFISGRIRCTLIKDDVHFGTALFSARNWEVSQKGARRVLKESIAGALIGGVIGFLIIKMFIV
jgi:hypothetical protein